MIVFVAVVLAVLAFLIVGGWIAQNVATATQAAATLETARALNSAQTANSFLTVAVIVLAILFAIAAVLVAILYVRFRANESAARESSGKWISGPGAKWGKTGAGPAQISAGPDMNSLIALMLLERMNGSGPARARIDPPDREPADEIDSFWKWG